MTENFVAMNNAFSMSVEQVERLTKNAIEGSFASEGRKNELLKKIKHLEIFTLIVFKRHHYSPTLEGWL